MNVLFVSLFFNMLQRSSRIERKQDKKLFFNTTNNIVFLNAVFVLALPSHIRSERVFKFKRYNTVSCFTHERRSFAVITIAFLQPILLYMMGHAGGFVLSSSLLTISDTNSSDKTQIQNRHPHT